MQSMNIPWVEAPSTGNVISRTIATYRANFLSMFGLAVVVNIPLTIWSAYMTLPLIQRMTQLMAQVVPNNGQDVTALPALDQGTINQLLGVYSSFAFTYIAINFLLFVVVYSAISYLTSEYQFGHRISIIEAFGAISGRLPIYSISLIIVILVVSGLTYGLAIVLFLCGFGVGILGWLLAGLLPFLAPVFMLERTNIMSGISRTFALGKLHLWPVVRVTLVFSIASILLNLLLTYILPDSGTASTTATATLSLNSASIVNLVISSALSALFVPLLPIAFTIMYYDARVRYEGLDAALATVGKSDARPADIQSPPAGPLIERRDVSNILIMTMVVFGLGIAFYAALFLIASATGAGI